VSAKYIFKRSRADSYELGRILFGTISIQSLFITDVLNSPMTTGLIPSVRICVVKIGYHISLREISVPTHSLIRLRSDLRSNSTVEFTTPHIWPRVMPQRVSPPSRYHDLCPIPWNGSREIYLPSSRRIPEGFITNYYSHEGRGNTNTFANHGSRAESRGGTRISGGRTARRRNLSRQIDASTNFLAVLFPFQVGFS
jgi:hypothetical protein